MKTEDFFKLGKNSIGYIGSNFLENFGGMEFTVPKKCKLQAKKLEKDMTGQQVLDEFKPKESNLGEIAYALKSDLLSKNGYSNLFYIKDAKGVAWLVDFYWRSARGYWRANAYPLDYSYLWDAAYQVLSRDFNSETKTLDPLKLELSEIMINGVTYKLIKK